MSKEEILKSSIPYLNGLCNQYPKRVCEDLGISPDKENDTTTEQPTLKESDYPQQFKKVSKRERKKAAEQYKSDADFLSMFPTFNADQYKNNPHLYTSETKG